MPPFSWFQKHKDQLWIHIGSAASANHIFAPKWAQNTKMTIFLLQSGWRQKWTAPFCQCGYGHNIEKNIVTIDLLLKCTKMQIPVKMVSKIHSFINSYGKNKLWTKTMAIFLCFFSPFWDKSAISRGSTSHMSSELIFMVLESGGLGEWKQLQS